MINHLHLLNIAHKIFSRDWKRGDMLVLLFAMSIVMASVSVIFLVIDRIESATEMQVADVLGADLVITSPAKIPDSWLQLAQQVKLKKATSVEFSSVLFANEKLQLSMVKAVSDNYPLRGRLEIADTPFGKSRVIKGPPPRGEVWVEPEIYHSLDLNKNSKTELGYSEVSYAGVLTLQPGQVSTLFNIAPTVIMNIEDLQATRIIQPGSRVTFRYLFSGDSSAVAVLAEKVKSELTASQRLLTIFDESPLAGSAIARSKKYIGLSSLLTIILSGVAIALSANRYVRRQFDLSALMRCFGMSSNQVLIIFVYILAFICLSSIVAGGIVGVLFYELMVNLLASSFVEGLPAANYAVLWLPVASTVTLLTVIALPSLLQIKVVPPMRVLRRQLKPLTFNVSMIYLISGGILTFVLWLQMRDIQLLMSVILGVFVLGIIFAIIASLLLKVMRKLALTNSAAVNFSLRQLQANKAVTLLHLLAFSITLFVIATIVLVRGELLSKWQQSLDENAPNHFLYNLRASQVEPVKNFFNQHELKYSRFYPMVRGRITGINGHPVYKKVSAEALEYNALKRELNITWSDNVPEGNLITAGEWGWNLSDSQHSISLDEKTANALGLVLGDTLNFKIGADDWQGIIVNIRRIDWQTFTPNFYVIAEPGALSEFNATYINSFLLPASQQMLLPALAKMTPGVTIVEFDKILKEIQNIIVNATTAVELIMIFVVAAGLALLWAALEHTFEAKYRQSAILRTLGAEESFIARCFRFEYLWLALLSSLMGVLAVELVSFLLYTQVFDIPFEFHWNLWIVLPVSVFGLMLAASWRGVKKVTRCSPLSLIR